MRTEYLVQRVVTGERTIWPEGKPPRQERRAYYETVFKTESRREAVALTTYELKRTGVPHRIITAQAWRAAGGNVDGDQPPASDQGKKPGKARARRTARPARATRATREPARPGNRQPAAGQAPAQRGGFWQALKSFVFS